MTKVKPDNHINNNDSQPQVMNNETYFKNMYEQDIAKKRRNCTDILCLILFIVFILVQVILSIMIFATAGDPSNLLLPHDSNGNVCSGSTPDLFYYNMVACLSPTILVTGCSSTTICVSSCPSTNLYYVIDSDRAILYQSYCSSSLLRSYYGSSVPANVSLSDYSTLAYKGICPFYGLTSTSYFGRCIPDVVRTASTSTAALIANDSATGVSYQITDSTETITGQLIGNAANSLFELLNLQTIAQFVLQDFVNSWLLIVILLIIAAVASFIYIVVIRFILAPLIYLSLIGIVGGLGFCIYFCVTKYISLKNSTTQITFQNGFDINAYLSLSVTWLVAAIISGILLVVVLLVFLVLFKRVRLAIQIISEASKAITSVFVSLFFPVLPLLLQLGFLAYFVATAVYLACSGSAIYKVANVTNSSATNYSVGDSCNPNDGTYGVACVYYSYGFDWATKSVNSVISFLSAYQWLPQLFNLFMFFWVQAFIVGLNQMVLAGSFGIWYWSKAKSSLILLTSLKDTLIYHLGSVAFGSLILAICQFMRVMIQFVEKRLKKATGNHAATNRIISFMMCCCKCCFWCLEKVLKFINRNAYIMVAIYGRNFCRSAIDAVTLLASNPLRALVLDGVSDFVFFLGRLLITVGVGVLGFFFFSKSFYIAPPYTKYFAPDLHYYWVQLLTVILGAYVITKVFFTVFEMAVDTVFLCAMKDLSINDGTPEKPYFMSTKLLKILNKKNVAPQVKEQLEQEQKQHNAAKSRTPEPVLPSPSAPIYPQLSPDNHDNTKF